MANHDLPAASVTISFTTEAAAEPGFAYALQGEVAPEDNGGETRFIFGGAAPVYRVYKSDNIGTVRHFPSDGSVGGGGGAGSRRVEEVVVFSGSRTANTFYPIHGNFSAVPLGNANLGSISPIGASQIQCSKTSSGPEDPIIGVYKVSYTSNFTRHRLNGVTEPAGFGEGDFDSYPVYIHLLGLV